MSRAEKILFASDVHWRPDGNPETVARDLFSRFLRHASARARAGDVSALYIVGDLFDVWFERDGRGLADYRHHVAELARARRAGLAVRVLFGNRDFLYRTALQRAGGVALLGDRAELNLGGRRVLLHHGDLFCTRDRRYQAFRRFVRSLPVRALASLFDRKTAERAARAMIRASEGEKGRKGLAVTGIVEETVIAEHRKGFQTVICGHVHHAERRRLVPDRRDWELITLGAWDEGQGSYLEHDGQGCFALKRFRRS